MPLSTNTLFHFTNSPENLLSILRRSFRPSYCLETAPFADEAGIALENGTPMVCFCDVPLSQAAGHITTYGEYAIGLTKEWGKKNGVAPVFYTHDSSPISRNLLRLMNRGLQLGKGPIDQEVWDEVVGLMSFVKPYEGVSLRNGQRRHVRFYDEREWRWVPQDLPEALRYGIDSSEFTEGKAPPEATVRLQDCAVLDFVPGDIRYLIVAREEEIGPLIPEILAIKQRFDESDKRLLTTRIVSAERIREDF